MQNVPTIPIEKYDFKQVPGVKAGVARALKASFKDWSQIMEADDERLLDIDGVTGEIVDQLRSVANAQLHLAERAAVSTRRISDVPGKGERLFVLSEQEADSRLEGGRVTNVKRRRTVLTPAVCPECGIDLLRLRYNGRPWDKLSAASQEECMTWIERHKAKVHSLASKRILTEEEYDRLGRSTDTSGDDEDFDA